MRDQRTERDRPVDVDGIESRHAMKADDLPRRTPPAMDLNHEIGLAGEEATLCPEPHAQLDSLSNRQGLVVVEAHLFRHSARYARRSSRARVADRING